MILTFYLERNCNVSCASSGLKNDKPVRRCSVRLASTFYTAKYQSYLNETRKNYRKQQHSKKKRASKVDGLGQVLAKLAEVGR
jgi:hypothetical protein